MERGRLGEGETRRHGAGTQAEYGRIVPLPVSPSPCLLVSFSLSNRPLIQSRPEEHHGIPMILCVCRLMRQRGWDRQ